MEVDFYKNRSATACMRAAFMLLTDNLSSLVKHTWWAMLAYAVCSATTLYFGLPNKGLHDWGVANPWASFLIQTLVYALTIASLVATGSAVWSWLGGRKLLANVGRYLTGLAMGGAIAAVSCALSAALGKHAWASVAALALGLVALVPMAYVQPKLMMRREGERLAPWKWYLAGLRHWGGLLAMGLLGGIILALLGLVAALPAIILGGAQTCSQLGALGGDPLGVPPYFTPLLLTVTTAVLFAYAYVASWLGVAYAYLCGAYDTQDKERKNINIK